MVGLAAWTALGLVAGGMALIGEGLKVVDKRAGSGLQWILLALGFPTLFLWGVVKCLWRKSEKKKREIQVDV